MAMRPFETRLWPIRRSERSFFDPGWEVGTWRDFGFQRPAFEDRMRQLDTTTQRSYLEDKMREMESQMEAMFRSFNQLVPVSPAIGGGALMSPAAPGALAMAPMVPPQMEQLKIENPYVTDKDGNRKLQLQFDVRQFQPEEIQVKTENRQLCVHARHEEKGEGSQVYREYQRYYLLPDNLEPDRLASVLSPEGVLTIEAPLPAIEAPKPKADVHIPIMHN